jgi:hypothetical protein
MFQNAVLKLERSVLELYRYPSIYASSAYAISLICEGEILPSARYMREKFAVMRFCAVESLRPTRKCMLRNKNWQGRLVWCNISDHGLPLLFNCFWTRTINVNPPSWKWTWSPSTTSLSYFWCINIISMWLKCIWDITFYVVARNPLFSIC